MFTNNIHIHIMLRASNTTGFQIESSAATYGECPRHGHLFHIIHALIIQCAIIIQSHQKNLNFTKLLAFVAEMQNNLNI